MTFPTRRAKDNQHPVDAGADETRILSSAHDWRIAPEENAASSSSRNANPG